MMKLIVAFLLVFWCTSARADFFLVIPGGGGGGGSTTTSVLTKGASGGIGLVAIPAGVMAAAALRCMSFYSTGRYRWARTPDGYEIVSKKTRKPLGGCGNSTYQKVFPNH